ncbi:hypothetical protein PG994_015038 [Apiospora phragmitis]|uniref:Uncharacterized protein n=1 Tax=Apiospora phragmitis TaxID=2905665 RepID=A0ABR1SWM3_9PEZI
MASLALDGLTQPNDEESRFYYYGLSASHGEVLLYSKSATASGPELKLEDQYPAVVLINVEYGTTFNQVSAATRTIKNILERNRLDIHVEIRENDMYKHTAISKASEHSDIRNLDEVVKDEYWVAPKRWKRPNVELLPLLSTLGWEVSKTASKEHHENGTAGPFIVFDVNQGLFATTCYHVLLPMPERPKVMESSANGETRPKVSQACPTTVAQILRLATDRLENFQEETKGGLAKIKKFDEWRQSSPVPKPEQPTVQERTDVTKLKYLEDIVPAVNTVYEDKDVLGQIKPYSGLAKRKIGFIYAAPEFEVCNSEGPIPDHEIVGFLNDWVLIHFDETKFTNASNKLYLGSEGASQFTNNFLHDSNPKAPVVPKMGDGEGEAFEGYIESNGGFLPLKGYLNYTLEIPTSQGKTAIPSVRVVKRGATTNLTPGYEG